MRAFVTGEPVSRSLSNFTPLTLRPSLRSSFGMMRRFSTSGIPGEEGLEDAETVLLALLGVELRRDDVVLRDGACEVAAVIARRDRARGIVRRERVGVDEV